MAKKETDAYSADSMDEYDDKTHLRKRPAITLGGETGTPSHPFSTMQRTCVREVYENSVDEGLQGFADKLSVSFFPDHSFEVQDNGRGIPTDVNKKTGKSGIMQAIGTLRSGRNFDSHSNKRSTGTNGLGAAAVAVFSQRYDVVVYRDDKQYSLSFKHGTPGFFAKEGDPTSAFTPIKELSELKVEKDSRSAAEKKGWETGTKTRVWLDTSAFPTEYPYDEQEIIERLMGSAFLVPELTIYVRNELKQVNNPETGKVEPQTEVFHFPDGMSQMVDHITPAEKLTDTIYFSGDVAFTARNVTVVKEDGSITNEDVERTVPYEVAFAWNKGYDSTIRSYVNTVNTQDNGDHVNAFEKTMQKVLNEKFSSMRGMIRKGDEEPTLNDFEEGLTLVVSVYITEPSFTGQTKSKLSSREVEKALSSAFKRDFESWIAKRSNSDDLNTIAQKVTTASKNRQQARAQRDLKRQKNAISNTSMPAKLKDCSKAGTEEAELYICEGDSALSSLKAARNSDINALLPVRGKVINPMTNSTSKVLNNEEVQSIIVTLGAGFGDSFDIEKMRYGKVLIATDADVDGNHIAVLLFTLFWDLFRPVIEEERLFVVQTPLFTVKVFGKNHRKIHAKNEEERDAIVSELQKTKENYEIIRLKGLGEVNANVLEETAIDPQTRTLVQIKYEDAAKIAETLNKFFTKDTKVRKEWLNAAFAEGIEEALEKQLI